MNITLGQSLAAYISAVLGAVLAVMIGVSHRQLCALISFAAGVLLSAAIFHILPEASETGVGTIPIFLATASGYALFSLISRYVSHVCPACAASHFEKQEEQPASKFKNIFFLMAIALTVHSMMDGIAIALSPAMSRDAGYSIFSTVAIHKLPEGLALCALLINSGYERKAAFFLTLLFEISTLAGWGFGALMLRYEIEVQWLMLAMVHIAGGFVFLALHAVINEIRDHSPRFVLIFFLTGFAFMMFFR
ncbi:MAG: ZIP family metal transporter [Candidatus Omnitrophica bacterium]|nr:ZIP family metal transporter [Candidatus Omnitrophota bacterium]